MVWRGSICRRAGGIAGLVFLSCNTFFAQESSVQSPHSAVSDIATGSRTFRSRCAVCHGLAGAGGRGPNLSRGEFRHGVSDAALFRNISDGISGSEMPGTFLARNQVWQLVAYIRSLSHQPETNLSGDTLKGKELFRDNGDCLRCHMVNGEGGRLGPDLSDIGSVRSPDFLRTSILEPNAEVDSHYQSVQIIDKEGKKIYGIRLNEDTYSIQIMDMQENLRSFWKEDQREIQISRTSWMPGYEGKFSADQLDDLIAYLNSLRRNLKTQ